MTEPIKRWSKDKLDLLAKYLRAYTTVMHHQTWLKSCTFVDSFAGAGQFHDPDTLEYVDGSPLVALGCDPPFDDYWFIDLSPTKIRHLQANIVAAEGRTVWFQQAEANEVLAREIAPRITYESFRRGLVFLDPYDLQVRWDTVEKLAATRALDVFVNFPIMGINRLMPREARPDIQALERLRLIFKDTIWIDDLYNTQGGLFGDPASVRSKMNAQNLARRYVGDMREVFPHISEPIIMRNSKNAPLYALFLASPKPTAVRITNSIFGKYLRESAAWSDLA